MNNPVNKANNFCLHLVSRRNKTTSVRGIGRRCERRSTIYGQHSNFDFDRPVLSQERFPSSGFLTRAVSPLIGSASAGSVLDSHNLDNRMFFEWIDGSKLPPFGVTPEFVQVDNVTRVYGKADDPFKKFRWSSRPGPRMTFGTKLPECRKGDAREGVKAMRLGSEGTKADPCRESCRFHQRNKAFLSCTAYKGSTAVQLKGSTA